MSLLHQQKMIAAARGIEPADLLITNVNLVNTVSGEIHPADVAVKDEIILGLECCPARKVVDGHGAFLCPGFIEAHIHIESTLLSPLEFAKTVASRGTCAVICDPHEIANVLGIKGIEYFLNSTKDLPVSVYPMLSSCVPATHLEDSGACIDVEQIRFLLAKYPGRFPGLGEMMNFPGVIFADPNVLAKLELTKNMVIDGHAPGLSGKDLSAYILAGPRSDHECVSQSEALEKLRKGMHIMIRQGTSQHNMAALLPQVNDHNWHYFSLVSDDRHPQELAEKGHLDEHLRKAVKLGLDPVRAIQMVTINPARYFGFKNLGAIAPGYRANMVLLDDLKNFCINEVYLQGKILEDCSFQSEIRAPGNTMHIKELSLASFQIIAAGKTARAIEIIPGQILTGTTFVQPQVIDGLARADQDSDLVKLAVIERHKGTGNIGLGFLRGLGLRNGALASTVAHDSHNLIVAGTSDENMLAAAEEVQKMGGGLALVQDKKVLASVPLAIAGLMSDKSLSHVVSSMNNLTEACRAMEIKQSDPFMILSFLALPVIPELKLTDKGLVDVNKFEIVDLWTD